MFAGFVLVLTFPDLLLDFLTHHINRRIQVALRVLGKEVGPGHAQANGTTKRFLRDFGMIVLQGDAGVDREAIQVGKLFQATNDVIFNRLRQRHVMRRKYQFHARMMPCSGHKIQCRVPSGERGPKSELSIGQKDAKLGQQGFAFESKHLTDGTGRVEFRRLDRWEGLGSPDRHNSPEKG